MEYRELGDDMSGRAEAVDAEPARVADELPGAIADEPGAHQRGCFGIRVSGRDLEGIGRVGRRIFGVASVDGVAGEARGIAQVLAARAAIGATATRRAEPRHAHPFADLEAADPGSDGDDVPDDLVAGDDMRLGMRQVAVNDVQIGAADAARCDPDQDLPALWRTNGALHPLERCADVIELHREHARGQLALLTGAARGRLSFRFGV